MISKIRIWQNNDVTEGYAGTFGDIGDAGYREYLISFQCYWERCLIKLFYNLREIRSDFFH